MLLISAIINSMGNCTLKDEEGNEISAETISKSCFNFLFVIGRGGFGKVWKIEKKSSKKQYAVKEISKVKLFEMNSISSVLNEIRLLSHLRHPFIINMHYSFVEKENVYIVMDFKQGGDLRYHISKKQVFTEDQISYLFLTDMGIARLFIGEKQIVDDSGTPGYMAPEVITKQPHDLTSDYYSVGIMLYELMFGKRPYTGKSKKEMKDAILAKEINVKVADLPSNWSNESADLVSRLLKRKSESRLGKNGIQEIKSHLWFRNIDWDKLYKKELVSPFPIEVTGENYDKKFVNDDDPVDAKSYDIILKKVNREVKFDMFYFNFYDPKKEKYFEYKGKYYIFQNLHDEQEVIKTQNIKKKQDNDHVSQLDKKSSNRRGSKS